MDRIVLKTGFILLRTEFIGVDDRGDMMLWQTLVEWSDMHGHSMSMTRWLSATTAAGQHAELLTALQTAAALLDSQAI